MKPVKPTKPVKKPASNLYSATEVGTLLESMDKKIDHVLEGHVGLDKRLESLEIEVHANSRRLGHLELVSNVINGKVTRLEDAVSFVSKGLKDTREELKTDIKSVETKLSGDIQKLGDRLATVEVNR